MFDRIYVAASALIYGGIGVACLVAPEALLAPVHVRPDDAVGVVELRAMYGGLEVGMAVFLLWCLRTGQTRPGVVAAWASIGALGLVRGVAWVMAGAPPSLHPWLLLAEGTALVLGPLAYRSSAAPSVATGFGGGA